MNKQIIYIPTKNSPNNIYGLAIYNDEEWIHKQDLIEKEAFVFTSEELTQLLEDTFDAGVKYEYEYDMRVYDVINRKQYIENFLNKEK